MGDIPVDTVLPFVPPRELIEARTEVMKARMLALRIQEESISSLQGKTILGICSCVGVDTQANQLWVYAITKMRRFLYCGAMKYVEKIIASHSTRAAGDIEVSCQR